MYFLIEGLLGVYKQKLSEEEYIREITENSFLEKWGWYSLAREPLQFESFQINAR
ncbi:MAG: hypothetical protein H7A24_17225 [Leptospiraceae bacterium]|nr:hypothetical protein [Leptospiraceae bacterium]